MTKYFVLGNETIALFFLKKTCLIEFRKKNEFKNKPGSHSSNYYFEDLRSNQSNGLLLLLFTSSATASSNASRCRCTNSIFRFGQQPNNMHYRFVRSVRLFANATCEVPAP